MLDIEGEACFYAAEQGESLHAALRFVRAYMAHRLTNGTPHAGGKTIPQFYRFHSDVRTAFDDNAPTKSTVPFHIVRGEN
jgi:hypothetical protein